MIYMIDTADIEDIKKAFDLYPVQGVTTNPSILAKEGLHIHMVKEHLEEIIDIIKPSNGSLHVQPVGETAEVIIAEAKHLKSELCYDNLYIKIPAHQQGVKAMKALSKEGFKITATAIITPQQAVVAAQAGAEFLAPYINRIDDIGGCAETMVAETVRCLEIGGLDDAKILGASFKNVQQVHTTILAGAKSVTINADTLDRLLYHPLSEWSIDKFQEDWCKQYKDIDLTQI